MPKTARLLRLRFKANYSQAAEKLKNGQFRFFSVKERGSAIFFPARGILELKYVFLAANAAITIAGVREKEWTAEGRRKIWSERGGPEQN